MLNRIGNDVLRCLWRSTQRYRTVAFYMYIVLTTCTTICTIIFALLPILYVHFSVQDASETCWLMWSLAMCAVLMWVSNGAAQFIYSDWQRENTSKKYFTISYHST
jgi:hypothetical protein